MHPSWDGWVKPIAQRGMSIAVRPDRKNAKLTPQANVSVMQSVQPLYAGRR
jgi:hypothetical protein